MRRFLGRNLLPAAWPLLVLTATFATSAADEERPVDYAREIRPILSNHCFHCHGTDPETREGELRLDIRDAAVEKGAIVPGNSADSELVQRIRAADESVRMPPAAANKPLSGKQIELLERWIAQGAPVSEHWAFTRIEAPAVPEESQDPWCRNEIDAFVLARLRKEKLEPSIEADRYTQIRRLYQDLIGLLPTPEEADAFANDDSPEAYRKLVERLLDNPHYGERWGRHWLDQARYADSHGYTIDAPRIMWPYRDWVIRAFNDDLPFDRFTIEQLAGDLLPNPTRNQLIATAFHRNTMINQEGGVKPDQFKHEATIDRVNTTGAVWLGLTIGCAQCHSHKYDPVTQEEYYRLYAFFNAAEDQNNVGPTVPVREQEVFGWTDDQLAKLKELEELRKQVKAAEVQVTQGASLGAVPWKWVTPGIREASTAAGAALKALEDGSLLADSTVGVQDVYTVTLAPVDEKNTAITAIRLRVLTDDSLPQKGPGLASNGNFVLSEIELSSAGTRLPLGQAWADHSQPNYDVSAAIDGKPDTGWAINVDGEQVQQGKKMNAPHEAIFTLAPPAAAGELTVVIRHDVNKNYQIGRFALDVTTTPIPAAEETRQAEERLAQLKPRVLEIEQTLPGRGASVPLMVMKNMAKTPETYLLKRGEFLAPDKESGVLSGGVPAALAGEQSTRPMPSRLELAQWLVSRENPLTARVIVNRVWGKFFGKGIVETENDFGFQGAMPTHPELLDWLAADWMENGWSMKHLHRRIVLSATYRQASETSPEMRQRDPRNLLLARQSRFRVEGEIVRDQALSASGLLTATIGGPSVHPPQPEGIYAFTQNKKDWATDTGPNRYRRTMYTMFYRSAPYPLMSTFDAPDFSTVCTQRVRSNTPLQSLTVANDEVFRELAVGLAKRVVDEPALASDDARCRRLFRLVLTRNPEPTELQILGDYFRRERERFSADPTLGAAFVKTIHGESSSVELAAWTSVARILINTDEFMTRN